ncbi:hypothetical protein HanRHA438_Chr02g0093621 [Helianthus annuus]|nr:hypothetical protein HanRHA438_Chr02g0093621 [Helianthus annuus]
MSKNTNQTSPPAYCRQLLAGSIDLRKCWGRWLRSCRNAGCGTVLIPNRSH